MIAGLAGLLVCQLAGEILVRALHLPLPGPVAGLGVMFAFLVSRERRQPDAVPEALGRVTDAFLANLSVLFVPAAVGIVQYLGLLRHYAWQIALAIVVSTIVALVVTASTFRLVSRLRTSVARDAETPEPEHRP